MIDHGADVNIEDSIGNTPLNLACTSGQIAIVGVLLRAGARLSSTKLHPTPLVVALTRLQSMMVDDKLSISSAEVRKAILEVSFTSVFLFDTVTIWKAVYLFHLVNQFDSSTKTVNS